jgi:ligand-binding sensor domain-containing protein/class 3 adenylate cyclase/predicted metal-dependent HD superfamily phosphohydrolase
MNKILSLIFFLIGFYCFNQSSYRFKNYTISDGLSQSFVSTIIQDKYGQLWFGTQDGLNRFDGQTFESFVSDNTPGIDNSYIHTSFKDRNGNLWFGTANGLLSYKPHLEKFESFQLKDGFALQIETITEDKKGNLWLGTSSNGICVFSIKNKKFNFFTTSIPSNKIIQLQFLELENLLVSTEDKGVFLINTNSKKIQEIKVVGKSKAFVRVNVIINQNENHCLFGTNQGVYQFNKSTNLVIPYFKEVDELSGDVEVSDILIDNDNQYFIASKSHGLLTLRKVNSQFIVEQNTQDIFQKNALLHNAINKLYKDKNNTFWVASERGVSSFNPYIKGFLSVTPSGDPQKGIPSPNVWCFAEDPLANYLFVGTDNAVSRKNRKTGKFEQFLRNKNMTTENSESSILCLYAINPNNLLIGTTEGLYQLFIKNTYDYQFVKLKYKGITNPSNFDKTYRILHWKEDLFFIATKGGALLYDIKKQNFKSFEHNPLGKNNTIQPGFCKVVFKDKSNNVWFTTTVGGLNQLIEDKNGLKIVPYKHNNTISLLSKDYITNICQTDTSTFWFGTIGSGIIKYDFVKNEGKIFTKKDGLPNNVVYAILQDKNKNLWLSTNKGISKIAIENNNKIINYSEIDGLVSTEFNLGAYLLSKNNLMYFGTINGYNYFDPNHLSQQNKRTKVVFTKFKLDENWIKPKNRDKILTKSISETNRIELNYKQRSFTIKFMSIDMSNPNLVSYKYILEGSDEGEIFIGNSNQIHFNALQSGEYVLKVYAKIGNGEWSIIPAELQIEIASPFWKTVWFWVILIVFVGILLLVVTRKRIEEERREQVRLEMKIVERTREIREQNVKIEKQKQLIEEKRDSLEEQKRLLEVEKEKTEKLLKNIIPESTMHELKTKGKASARAYKTVSVMFTDFVGFTKIAEHMSPSDLVNELDIYFRKFDEIVVRNNLEKIKTIGDAYMCAGGVPVRNNTNPVDACLAALQIQEAMEIMREEAKKTGREVWNLRLGINTGEVTAGVIGSEKLAYDIWGATVNQAQRMEMLGEPGKVSISGQTFQFIEPYFVCKFKGKVKSKSKGLIDMYTVEGIKPELSIDGKGIYPNEKFQQIFNLHHYSSINYYKAERYIMKILEKKLSPKLHYHSISHTKDVCSAVERLALLEGVTDEGLFLLKSAATYHDAGFVESYEKNEPVGARMAGEILPKFGYTEEHIEQIRKLIYVTQIPHKPTNKLEEIICDADLDYLGTDNFHEIADRLRLELREHGKIDSDRKWDEIQVMFLTNHQYFTKTAKETRQSKKDKHLQEIKERLKRNEYVD